MPQCSHRLSPSFPTLPGHPLPTHPCHPSDVQWSDPRHVFHHLKLTNPSWFPLGSQSIVYTDYPGMWPDLLPAVLQNIQSPEHPRLHGALYALRIIARKYEFKDEVGPGPVTVSSTAAQVCRTG